MLVVDASVAVAAALAEDGFAPLPPPLVAPRLLRYEALSVLHELRSRATVSDELADDARRRLLRAPIEDDEPDDLAVRAWDVADALGWAKVYDAYYVALAELRACPLVTLDARLRRGAGRRVIALGPAEV